MLNLLPLVSTCWVFAAKDPVAPAARGSEAPPSGGASERGGKESVLVFVLAALVGILVSYMASGERVGQALVSSAFCG